MVYIVHGRQTGCSRRKSPIGLYGDEGDEGDERNIGSNVEMERVEETSDIFLLGWN